jgi:hypothetical protein
MPFRARLLAATLLTCIPALTAQAAPLRAGSGNEAVIEPPVPVPNETPCTVPLVTKQIFGADSLPYTYAPPNACPGPWAKVVLKISISLNQGRQFDRTGTLFLAGIPLWYGTTAEPRATLSPNWTFEKDVTDYTAIFGKSQAGMMAITNYVSSVYTSSITGSAELLFYPPTAAAPPWTCISRANPGTSSGTPVPPRPLPHPWNPAAPPPSVKVKSPSTARPPASPPSPPGSSPAA